MLSLAACGGSSTKTETVTKAAAAVAAASTGTTNLQTNYVDVIDRVSPQVVQISNPQGLGSGVVMDGKGDIVGQPLLALHISPTDEEAKRFRRYWEGVGRSPFPGHRSLASPRHRRPDDQLHRVAASPAARAHAHRDPARDRREALVASPAAQPNRAASATCAPATAEDHRHDGAVSPAVQAMTERASSKRREIPAWRKASAAYRILGGRLGTPRTR